MSTPAIPIQTTAAPATATAPTPIPTPTPTASPVLPTPAAVSQTMDSMLSSMLNATEPTPTPTSTPEATPVPTPSATPAATEPPATDPNAPPPIPTEGDEFQFDEEELLFKDLTEPPPADPATPAADPNAPPTSPTPASLSNEEEAPADPFLQTPRGQRIYSGYKLVRQLMKPPEEGGIGRQFTAEEVRNWHDSSASWEGFTTELRTPAAAESVAANLLDLAGPTAPALVNQFVEQLYQRSNAGDPAAGDAYVRVGQRIGNDLINELVETARTESNPEWKSAFFGAAKVLKAYLTNRQEDLSDDLLNAPARDPLREREEAIRRREEELNRRTQGDVQSQWRNYVQETQTQADAQFRSAIETSLAGENNKFRNAVPKLVFEAMVDKFEKSVAAGVHSNTFAQNEFKRAFMNARAVFSKDPAQAKAAQAKFTKTFMRYAAPLISHQRGNYLREMATAAKQANAAIHNQRQQTAATVREPSAGAAPTQQPMDIAALSPKPGESKRQQFDRTFATLFS